MRNSITVVGSKNTTVNITNNVIVGWPPSWPVPDAWPAPFEPETLRLDKTTCAAAATELRMAGAAAEAPRVAEIVMRVVQDLHTDPAGRNVYPNPSRCDQALTFAAGPDRWDVASLSDAQRRLIGNIARSLQAIADPQHPLPPADAVCRAAAPAFAAHLANLQAQAAAGVCTQYADARGAACGAACGAPPPRFFGDELLRECAGTGILDLADAASAEELAGAPPDEASLRIIPAFDYAYRAKDDANHTAFEHAGYAWVWDNGVAHGYGRTPSKWTRMDIADASRECATGVIKEFSRIVGRLDPARGNEDTSIAILTRLASRLTYWREETRIGTRVLMPVLTPAGVELASGPVALAIFARRSERARAFYLAPPAPDTLCQSSCGCSRASARAILEH